MFFFYIEKVFLCILSLGVNLVEMPITLQIIIFLGDTTKEKPGIKNKLDILIFLLSLYFIVCTCVCTYILYILEVNSQTKYEFYIFIETLQIVSSMCSLQMSM